VSRIEDRGIFNQNSSYSKAKIEILENFLFPFYTGAYATGSFYFFAIFCIKSADPSKYGDQAN